MSLKVLNINFKSEEEILEEINSALFEGVEIEQDENELTFDSVNTFNKALGQNRLTVLLAISQLKPKSVNELKQFVNRNYPHVLNDCRKLESLGFIRLIETGDSDRKTLRPELIFDYDVIQVNSQFKELLPISERSNRMLEEATAIPS